MYLFDILNEISIYFEQNHIRLCQFSSFLIIYKFKKPNRQKLAIAAIQINHTILTEKVEKKEHNSKLETKKKKKNQKNQIKRR